MHLVFFFTEGVDDVDVIIHEVQWLFQIAPGVMYIYILIYNELYTGIYIIYIYLYLYIYII